MNTLFLALLAAQDLPPKDAVARMRPADGFEVRVVAHEPAVRQPVTITFDDRGRLWVLQYLQYPEPAGLTAVQVDEYLRTVYDKVPEPPPKGPRGADRVTILEDRDGDGFYETAKDFVDGLNLASGMCLGHGGLFVAQPPYLLFYPDRNRDDVPDGDPEVLLSGFGMEDSHAYANSLQWGPDGWLYGAHGSTVTAKIRGIEFQQGIWRYHPITKAFELFAEGGGNTWGLDFDRRGNAIAGTNFGGYAMLHQVQGAYYVKGFTKHGPLHNPHAYGYFEHVPHKGFKGGHVTCGGIVYHGGAFGDAYEGKYIGLNPLSNDIYVHEMSRTGSTFAARTVGDLLIGNDPWFRPVDSLVGPDGALYVADWYDKRLNHVDPRNTWDRTNGRIYRIAPKGLPTAGPLDLAARPSAELVALLRHKNEWYRREARRLLAERHDAAAVSTLKVDEPGDLWARYVCGVFDASTLDHPDEDVRAWTVRLLDKPHPKLLELARTDPSPVVRSQLACTAKRLPGPDAIALIRELARRDEDAADPYIPKLLWWAVEAHASAELDAVVDLLEGEAERPLVRDVLAERVARRFMAEDDVAACARLLQSMKDTRPLVRGFAAALEGRRLPIMPPSFDLRLRIMRRRNPQDLAVLRLAYRMGSMEAEADAREWAVDPKVPEADRIAVIAMLGESSGSEEVLARALRESTSDKLRVAAIGALQSSPAAAGVLLDLLPGLKGQARARAVQALVSRPASALALMKAVDESRLPKDVLPAEHVRTAAAFEDPALGDLLRKHFGATGRPTAGHVQARIRNTRLAISRNPGDAVRGRAHFQKLCASCHTIFGEGGKIAPDLTAADRKNLDLLLQNVLDPSAFIRPEFQAFKLMTTDGQVLTGLAVEQTASAVTLVDAQTNRTILPRERIQAMKPSELSLMPDGLIDTLDDQATADLFAFIRGDSPASPAPQEKKKTLHVCLLSGSLEYESDASLAALQEHLEKTYDVTCTRAFRKTDENLPGLENLETADVAVVFTRRLKLSGDQLERVRKFFQSGKPVVGIRTASHAFQTWLDFDKEILGGSYSNHYGKGPECAVTFTDKAKGHPILEGVKDLTSKSSLYKNPANASDVEVLLMGTAGGKTEPLAWTRRHKGARVFYTSLGDQGDFKNPDFVRMVVNAIHWVAQRAPDRKQSKAEPLPGTAPLLEDGDFAAKMVDGLHRFLDRETAASVERRKAFWNRDLSSPEAYAASVEPNRARFRRIIGVVDERLPFEAPELVATTHRPALVGEGKGWAAYAVRWPVFRAVHGEGLLLRPSAPGREFAVALPDADRTPEQLAGLQPGLPPAEQTARILAEGGVTVVVPALIDRGDLHSVSPFRKTNQPHREWIYRCSFELGRHVIGYEVQKVLSAVDWFHRLEADPAVGVVGSGEGGLLALYAGAADPRIDVTVVRDYFGPREGLWKEPIYRNVWGLLREFGDAEIASLVAPRALHVEPGGGPAIAGPPPERDGRSGAAPGEWRPPTEDAAEAELARFRTFTAGLPMRGPGPFRLLQPLPGEVRSVAGAADPRARLKRQFDQLVADTQHLMRESEKVREAKLPKPTTPEAWPKAVEALRKELSEEVIGRFDLPLLPPNARTRQVFDEPAYRGYEVLLDVFPDVIAYGLLLVPKDIPPGERRPVVVAQHGLEGTPRKAADPGVHEKAYGRFGCRLAERGFVVFAPQNPYIGKDRFRSLQRKLNPLKRSLFSIIVPQHEQITGWLASLPFVDGKRIAFYGISYGGKTAMRVPPLVDRYCLSICSADFNEWVRKNVSVDNRYTYVTTGEYEMFEFDLAHRASYAEMAALVAPRPFMVERGHRDGVAPDEWVAYEYAKVRRLYADLGIPERTEIEYFDGPHAIHGVGTFNFLHKHLNWPSPSPPVSLIK